MDSQDTHRHGGRDMSIEKLQTQENLRPIPKAIVRPCEWGLRSAIMNLEGQLGSIEAYNMLVTYAEQLQVKIESGKGKAQNPYFATDPRNVK